MMGDTAPPGTSCPGACVASFGVFAVGVWLDMREVMLSVLQCNIPANKALPLTTSICECLSPQAAGDITDGGEGRGKPLGGEEARHDLSLQFLGPARKQASHENNQHNTRNLTGLHRGATTTKGSLKPASQTSPVFLVGLKGCLTRLAWRQRSNVWARNIPPPHPRSFPVYDLRASKVEAGRPEPERSAKVRPLTHTAAQLSPADMAAVSQARIKGGLKP